MTESFYLLAKLVDLLIIITIGFLMKEAGDLRSCKFTHLIFTVKH